MTTKPKRHSRKPAQRSKPAPSKPEVTRESLLAEIAGQLDAVDAAWADAQAGRRPMVSTARAGNQLNHLIDQLDDLLDPSGVDGRELIARELGAKPGAVPSWARPGTFLLWLDYVPIRCVWGGFAITTHDLFAVKPDELWLSVTGYRSMYDAIGEHAGDVGAYFRRAVERLTRDKKFTLVPLEQAAAERCSDILAAPENAWLRETVARGPVDPIPLPAHLQAVQQQLFG